MHQNLTSIEKVALEQNMYSQVEWELEPIKDTIQDDAMRTMVSLYFELDDDKYIDN